MDFVKVLTFWSPFHNVNGRRIIVCLNYYKNPVLGCISDIATIGAAPDNGLTMR